MCSLFCSMRSEVCTSLEILISPRCFAFSRTTDGWFVTPRFKRLSIQIRPQLRITFYIYWGPRAIRMIGLIAMPR
jgi:hypothetical protein